MTRFPSDQSFLGSGTALGLNIYIRLDAVEVVNVRDDACAKCLSFSKETTKTNMTRMKCARHYAMVVSIQS